jgi:ABC-type Fe3+/spermidine/putrescine transport system ATPase subunit
MSGGPVTGDDRKGSINLEKVTKQFALPRENREFTAVQDVSFEVGGGEFVSIVGPSGCGKSTLLSLIAGLVPVTEGRIGLATFEAVPTGMKIEPESVFDNRYVLKALGR